MRSLSGTQRILVKSKRIGVLEAVIDSAENPRTAKAVVESLPLEGEVQVWGDEVYFEVPLSLPKENARVKVALGEIAYWPEGEAICIFFGKNPASPSENDIRAYSPVNVFGKILGDPKVLKALKAGDKIRLDKA